MTVPLLHILQQQEVGTCACKVHALCSHTSVDISQGLLTLIHDGNQVISATHRSCACTALVADSWGQSGDG